MDATALLARADSQPPGTCFLVIQGLAGIALLRAGLLSGPAFAGVVLLGGPPPTAALRETPFGHWLARYEEPLSRLAPIDRMELLLNNLGPGQQPLDATMRKEIVTEAGLADTRPLLDVLHAQAAVERPDPSLPILHITGSLDQTIDADRSPWSAARTALLPGVGHFPGLDAPDMTSTLIDSFARAPART